MPFCDESLDFLFLNRLNDSKTFFNENRSEYERLVLQPLRQLVTDIEPAIHEIDPFLVCEPKVGKSISRIFRDTRFTHDKHIFRDVMWCTFYRDRKLFGSMPAFFFEFSPRCTRWGCGYYQCSTDLLELPMPGGRGPQGVSLWAALCPPCFPRCTGKTLLSLPPGKGLCARDSAPLCTHGPL